MRVPGHVAVGWHVHSFGRGRDVPYWRDGRGPRGEGHGARHWVTVVGVATLLEKLLKFGPLVLEPNLYLWRVHRFIIAHMEETCPYFSALIYLCKIVNWTHTHTRMKT